MAHEWRQGEYTVSDDPSRLDLGIVHGFLSRESYWARGRSRGRVERSIVNSLPFGVYRGDGRQVGFARVVTDRATFAWLADVFVVPEERGRGLSKWLVECVLAHPELQGLRRWLLATRDAQELYRRYGFAETTDAKTVYMEKFDPSVV
ncbi:MAG TPA: GNAT family N-acetyltransferase [Pyrinomonadaceae bacterium]|nr:GNAT family N-acetyltransferase [Pyrinomonadaceae bacterium]